MSWLFDLVSNPYLITGVSSWMVAQVMKFFIHALIYKKFELSRLFGDGGMPSGHSATVSSLAIICGLSCGLNSVEFAISAILAIIVCHDAMGVRLETGKQAVLLNELITAFSGLVEKKLPEVKLKEFVGHTPVQVIAGIIVGFVNAFVMYNILF